MGQSTSIVFSMRSMSFLLATRLTSPRCCKLRSDGTRYALAFSRIRGRLRIRTNAFPHKATRLLRRPSGALFYALHSGHVTCNVRVPHEPVSTRRTAMQTQQLKQLLLQSLEHERAGVEVYETAIRCAVSEDLKHQWSEYLEQTHAHVALLEGVLRKLEIDPEHASPGRRIVRSLGNALVMAMETAKASGGDRLAAQ